VVAFVRLNYIPASIMTCGSGSVTIEAQEAFVPSVVRYFPPFPDWVGRALIVPHETFVPSDVRYLPFAEDCDGSTAFAAPACVVAPVPPLFRAIVVADHVPVVTVPRAVKDEVTTEEFSVVEVRVLASAVTVISAEPSKATPLMFLVAANLVAVEALPVSPPTNVVEVTEVRPASVVDDAPSEIAVEPTVTEEFVRLELAIFDNVLVEPEIVLLVNVWAVFVSTISPEDVPPIVLPKTCVAERTVVPATL